ncbi:MAG: hypothetical protein ACYS3S_22310 [Planctomycetota bacterium]|jgi:hypothetical protein
MKLLERKRGFLIVNKGTHCPHNPLVVGSNPTGPIQQNSKNKRLRDSKQTNEFQNSENLVQILFSDAQLQQIVECRPKLSVELRKAIAKMVR